MITNLVNMELNVFPPHPKKRNEERAYSSEETQCLASSACNQIYANNSTTFQENHGSDCINGESGLHTISSLYAQLLIVFAGFMVLTEVLHSSVPVFYFHEYLFNYLLCGAIISLIGVYIRLWSKRSSVFLENDESSEISEKSCFSSKFMKNLVLSDINLYLRIGIFVFGLGTLISCVLEVGAIFTMPQDCMYKVNAVQPLLRGVFTFLQMLFLSLNVEEIIKSFGLFRHAVLMHLVATNLSVWLRILLWESSKDWLDGIHYKHNSSLNWLKNNITTVMHSLESDVNSPDPSKHVFSHNAFITYNCYWRPAKDEKTEGVIAYNLCLQNSTVGKVGENLVPYLYPFVIQYCLIAAGIIYITWSNLHIKPLNQLATSVQNITKPSRYVPNYAGSTKGLFLGVLILITGIFTIILFFALPRDGNFNIVFFISALQCGVYSVSSLAAILGVFQMRKMASTAVTQEKLDNIFQRLGTFSVYAYGVCNIIAGGISIDSSEYYQVFLEGLLIILQASVQSFFIHEVSTKKLYSPDTDQKPRGQVVIFLALSSSALWLLDTFTALDPVRNQLQMKFYGNVAWPVICRIVFPLVIFYRFHSCAVLMKVWRKCYSVK